MASQLLRGAGTQLDAVTWRVELHSRKPSDETFPETRGRRPRWLDLHLDPARRADLLLLRLGRPPRLRRSALPHEPGKDASGPEAPSSGDATQRYVLPSDLSASLRHLDDMQLDTLLRAAAVEARRHGPPAGAGDDGSGQDLAGGVRGRRQAGGPRPAVPALPRAGRAYRRRGERGRAMIAVFPKRRGGRSASRHREFCKSRPVRSVCCLL